jgi:hypothetical protein
MVTFNHYFFVASLVVSSLLAPATRSIKTDIHDNALHRKDAGWIYLKLLPVERAFAGQQYADAGRLVHEALNEVEKLILPHKRETRPTADEFSRAITRSSPMLTAEAENVFATTSGAEKTSTPAAQATGAAGTSQPVEAVVPTVGVSAELRLLRSIEVNVTNRSGSDLARQRTFREGLAQLLIMLEGFESDEARVNALGSNRDVQNKIYDIVKHAEGRIVQRKFIANSWAHATNWDVFFQVVRWLNQKFGSTFKHESFHASTYQRWYTTYSQLLEDKDESDGDTQQEVEASATSDSTEEPEQAAPVLSFDDALQVMDPQPYSEALYEQLRTEILALRRPFADAQKLWKESDRMGANTMYLKALSAAAEFLRKYQHYLTGEWLKLGRFYYDALIDSRDGYVRSIKVSFFGSGIKSPVAYNAARDFLKEAELLGNEYHEKLEDKIASLTKARENYAEAL